MNQPENAACLIRCDLCGADDTSPVAAHPESRLVRCNSCGLVYFNPQPTDAALRRYYASEAEGGYAAEALARWGTLTPERSEQCRLRLDELERELSRGQPDRLAKDGPMRFLDVGCAYGHLLQTARVTRQWDAVGVDLCQPANDWARRNLGLEIIHGTVPEAARQLPKSSFDIIGMDQVLEHTRRPTDTLQAAYELLKPGGILSVSVPNGDGIQARREITTWEWFHYPSHLYYYSAQTLRRHLEKVGFTVERVWSQAAPGTDLATIKAALALESLDQAGKVGEVLGPRCLLSVLKLTGRKP